MSNNDYEFLVASDVDKREGIGIELWKDDELILEIFRDDKEKTKSVTLYKKTVSLDLVEQSLLFFRKNVPEKYMD